MRTAAPSLKSCALRLLSQREHSRSELGRKLQAHARRDGAAADAAIAASQADKSHAGAATGDTRLAANDRVVADDAAVQSLLDELAAKGLLSDDRFIESRVYVRKARFGNRRIEHELAQHGLVLAPQARLELKASELQRAQQVWARKFGQAPVNAKERARQMRFLAGRGFGGESIRQVLGGRAEADEDAC